MNPGDLYVIAIVVTALFVAPFNAMARIVVLAWIVAHVGFTLGVSEIAANIGGQACVLVLGWRYRFDPANGQAWALSVPLLAVNLACAYGLINSWVNWWTVLVVAMAQLMILCLSVDANVTHQIMRVWRKNGGRGMFRTGVSK